MEEMIVRPFYVDVHGFGRYLYVAASRGKALAKAFGDWTSLRIAHAKATLSDNPRFGEAMTICGEPAFYVSHNTQYIQFVRPNSDVVLNSHPLDVEPPEARRGTPYYRPSPTINAEVREP